MDENSAEKLDGGTVISHQCVCVCVWVALIESDMIPKQTYFSGRWSFKEN